MSKSAIFSGKLESPVETEVPKIPPLAIDFTLPDDAFTFLGNGSETNFVSEAGATSERIPDDEHQNSDSLTDGLIATYKEQISQVRLDTDIVNAGDVNGDEPTVEPTAEPTAEPNMALNVEPQMEPNVEPSSEVIGDSEATAVPTQQCPEEDADSSPVSSRARMLRSGRVYDDISGETIILGHAELEELEERGASPSPDRFEHAKDSRLRGEQTEPNAQAKTNTDLINPQEKYSLTASQSPPMSRKKRGSRVDELTTATIQTSGEQAKEARRTRSQMQQVSPVELRPGTESLPARRTRSRKGNVTQDKAGVSASHRSDIEADNAEDAQQVLDEVVVEASPPAEIADNVPVRSRRGASDGPSTAVAGNTYAQRGSRIKEAKPSRRHQSNSTNKVEDKGLEDKRGRRLRLRRGTTESKEDTVTTDLPVTPGKVNSKHKRQRSEASGISESDSKRVRFVESVERHGTSEEHPISGDDDQMAKPEVHDVGTITADQPESSSKKASKGRKRKAETAASTPIAKRRTRRINVNKKS
jgi:hypothetical protein